jgi:uracil-DNA glycosylase
MQIVRLANETDFEGWRMAARSLLAQGVAPEHLAWQVGEKSSGLFDLPDLVPNVSPSQSYKQGQPKQVPPTAFPDPPKEFPDPPKFKVPRDFIELCRKAILHSDPARFALLYRMLWRLKQEPKLLQVSFDPDVAKAQAMVKAVRRDLHKMKAFVRFREITMPGGESEFIAWFEPSQHIVQASAAFFTARFTNMRWSILTPTICMHWDGATLNYGPGASKADAPTEDAGEDLWRAYYRSIFNPARLKVSAMLAQMPKKYWRNLPEAPLIAGLIAGSSQRMDSMMLAQPTTPQRKIIRYVAAAVVPPPATSAAAAALHALNQRMLAETDLPLALQATQAVLGSGIVPATLMLVASQPGEQDDLSGQPFTGAAGRLLAQALQLAGIARAEVYVTHVLKHFKFRLVGRRRVPEMPGMQDIQPYLPWLQAEIDIVQPKLIVALGKVAAHALTGATHDRQASAGKLLPLPGGVQLLVVDDTALNTSDKARKQSDDAQLAHDQLMHDQLVVDLKIAARLVAGLI